MGIAVNGTLLGRFVGADIALHTAVPSRSAAVSPRWSEGGQSACDGVSMATPDVRKEPPVLSVMVELMMTTVEAELTQIG